MGLVSMKPILRIARDNGYGVAAFNILDFLTIKAIIEAAEEIDCAVVFVAAFCEHIRFPLFMVICNKFFSTNKEESAKWLYKKKNKGSYIL